MWILILAFFVLQLISFYFIALLYLKMNRFKHHERQQELLIEEMEESMTAFLADIQDDNDRLIESLKLQPLKQEPSLIKQPAQEYPIEKSHSNGSVGQIKVDKTPAILKKTASSIESVEPIQSFNTPKAYVKNAYATIKPQEQIVPKTPEQQIKEMYIAGASIENIAKKMQKGKTEIELLLKFQNK